MTTDSQQNVIKQILDLESNICRKDLLQITKFIDIYKNSSELVNKFNLKLESNLNNNVPFINRISIDKKNQSILKYFINIITDYSQFDEKLCDFDQCPICLESDKNDLVVLNCNHIFHLSCLNESLKVNNICPYCRSEVHNFKILWEFLINLIYYNYDTELISKLVMRFPILLVENNNWHYYCIYDNEYFNYSIAQALHDNWREDVLKVLVINGYNIYKFLSFLSKENKIKKIKNIENKDFFLNYLLSESLKFDCYIDNTIFINDIYNLFNKNDKLLFKIYNDNIDNINVLKFIVNYSFRLKFSLFKQILDKTIDLEFDEFDSKEELFVKAIEFVCVNFKKYYVDNVIHKLKYLINRYLEKYDFNKFMSDYHIDSMNSNVINLLSGIKQGVRLLKIVNKHAVKHQIDLFNRYSIYPPLLDAARYSDFETFHYVIKKYVKNNIFDLSTIVGNVAGDSIFYNEYNCEINLLGVSLFNVDKRIFKHLLNNFEFYHLYKCNVHYLISYIDSSKESKDKIINTVFKILDKLMILREFKKITEVLFYIYMTQKISFSNKFLVKYSNFKIKYFNFSTSVFISISFSNMTNLEVIETCFLKRFLRLFDNQTKMKIYQELIKSKCICNSLCQIFENNINFKTIEVEDLSKIVINYGISDNQNYLCKFTHHNCLNRIIKKTNLNFKQFDNYKFRSFCCNSSYSISCFNDLKFDILMLNGYKLDKKHIMNTTYNYNNVADWIKKWIIIINTLKRFVRKRKRLNLMKHKELVNLLNKQIEYHPEVEKNIFKNIGRLFKQNILNISYQKKNPSHIKPNELINIDSNSCFITEKADGVTKILDSKINNIIFTPNIPNVFDNLIFTTEYIESMNLHIIFDFNILDTKNRSEFMDYFRNIHDFVPSEYDKNHTLIDFKEYLDKEKTAINKYVNYLKENNMNGWWPKKIWTSHNNNLEILKSLQEGYFENAFPNDGWIITNIEKDEEYKLKPKNHLTADLYFDKPKKLWYCNNNIKVDNICYNSNISSGVYRCYWENNKWLAKDFRPEKKYPNNIDLFNELTCTHKNYWTINDIIKIKDQICPYYSLDNDHNKIKHVESNYGDLSVLNIGSGYDHSYSNSHTTNIDIDLNSIYIMRKKYPKSKWLWMDFTEDFNKQDHLGKNLQKYVNQDLTFEKSYNVIMLINCIHYALDSKKWETMINNINNVSSNNTILIIRYLDKNKLDLLFNNTNSIVNHPNYISKINEKNGNYKLKIYHSWVHNYPKIENIVSFDNLKDFYKYGWELDKILEDNIIDLGDYKWNQYFRCFRTIQLKRSN